MKVHIATLLSIVLAACTSARPGTPPQPVARPVQAVIPRPVSMRLDAADRFRIDTSIVVVVDESADSATLAVAKYLRTMLAPFIRGEVQRAVASTRLATQQIRLTIDPAAGFGNAEGYVVDVTATSVSIAAPTPAGLFYGVQTIRQLMPASVEYPAAMNRRLTIPTGHIEDYPRFAWRGMMLDVSRHFLPPRDVKRFIDLISLYKMNRLHLHLADDQGWRVEIKSRPNLARIGGSTQIGGEAGGFFSQDEYREIVRYAESRFVTIVPEIDMPAHSNAAMTSYPELTCDHIAPPPFTAIGAPSTVMCVDSATIYPIIADYVREISAMTPGRYFHIGGDEVPGLSRAQYIGFIDRLQSIVSANGKLMIGWADIAPAHLSPATIVQQWSQDSSQLHVARGGKVIMSPSAKVYLDMKYDSTTALGLKWAGYVGPRTSYEWDPGSFMAGVPESAVLGVEGPLWSETLTRIQDFEFMAFPRAISIAEVGWTPQRLRNWDDFHVRLDYGRARLTALGVNAGW